MLRLEDDVARIELTTPGLSEREARELAEPHLRRWQAYTGLMGVRQCAFEFEFEFDSVEWSSAHIGPNLEVVGGPMFIEDQYPSPPPKQFVLSPDAEMLWYRYHMYLDGRDPSLAAMGYMCLSVLEAKAGKSRRSAAQQYNVAEKVLQKLGHLTLEVGDPLTARKAPKAAHFGPMLWKKSYGLRPQFGH